MKFDCDSLTTVFNPVVYPQRNKNDADNWQDGYEDCCKYFYRTAFRICGRWLQYNFWKMDNSRFAICDLADNSVRTGKSVYNDIDENTTFGFLPEAYADDMLATTHRKGRDNPSIMLLHLKR